MRERHPAKVGCLDVLVHYSSGRRSIYRGDANQQEVKLSTQQQDWRPEVSGVTCQAKEITACHRPTKDCPRHWPAKHAVSMELRRWWHDLTQECCLSEPFGNLVCLRITNLSIGMDNSGILSCVVTVN